jgi:hypothetical protein
LFKIDAVCGRMSVAFEGMRTIRFLRSVLVQALPGQPSGGDSTASSEGWAEIVASVQAELVRLTDGSDKQSHSTFIFSGFAFYISHWDAHTDGSRGPP